MIQILVTLKDIMLCIIMAVTMERIYVNDKAKWYRVIFIFLLCII